MSATWFDTPEKAPTGGDAQSRPPQTASATPSERPRRTEAEQAKIREERKRNKKLRKNEQQVFNRLLKDATPTTKSQPSRKSGASTAAQGRMRLKEAQEKEKEQLIQMPAGLNLTHASESIDYIAFERIINEGTHGIHRNVIGVIAGIIGKGRSKNGDPYLNMLLCDPSAPDSSKSIRLNLFARSEDELPNPKPSAVILVRHVFLQRFSHRIQGAGRKNDYTWALYDPDARSAKCSGQFDPPLGKEEAIYLDRLSKWWKLINPDVITPAQGTSRKTVTISQVQERVFCNIIAEVLFVADLPPPGALEICVTDYTTNSKLRENWHGLHGHRVMKLSLYDEQRVAGRAIASGNFVEFNNVRPKLSFSNLEGNMGHDFNKINVHRLSESDERLEPLLLRKQDYHLDIGLPDYMNTQSTHQTSPVVPEQTPGLVGSSLETPVKPRELKEPQTGSAASPEAMPAAESSSTSQRKTKLHTNEETIPVPIRIPKFMQETPRKFHIQARIIDFAPRMEDWVKAQCEKCDNALDTYDAVCRQCDTDAYTTYKYHFALLLEDRQGEIIPAFCYDEDGVTFLDGISPGEARDAGLVQLRSKVKGILEHLFDAEDPEEVDVPDEYHDFLIFSYKPVLDPQHKAYRVFCTSVV